MSFVVESLGALLPFVVIAGLFWLILIRPAQRRQRQAQATQRAAELLKIKPTTLHEIIKRLEIREQN